MSKLIRHGKKKEKETVIIEEYDDSVGTAADVEAVMRKYDRESNQRIWEGTPKIIVGAIMAAFAVYCIIDAIFLTTLPERRLAIFVGMIVLLGFLTFPVKKGIMRPNHIPWYDVIIMILGSGAYFYYAIRAMDVIRLSARIMARPSYMIIGIIGILALVELCRRCVGLPILCVAGALLIYTFASGQDLFQVVRTLFYTTNGIFGTPVNTCAKFIVIFIIFGAFLERTGVADFFIRFANTAVGRFTGGPAKVAVVASALEGMASGSSVANTVGSGSITIPMMKKMGYRPEFAAAVEAAASTGGQIMPPIMGAAAFLMAEYTGQPYARIALMAILPAVLYFTGIYIAVHLEAKKMGMKGIPKDELPKPRELVREIYLLAPLVALVYLVSTNTFTMAYSATLSIVVAILVGLNNPPHRLTFSRICEAFDGGERGSFTFVVACVLACGSYRASFRRSPDSRALLHNGLLHHSRNGRSDYGELPYHGIDLRPNPHRRAVRCCDNGSALLRILLRHRCGYNAASCACGICRCGYCKGESDEDRAQCDTSCHCGIHRSVYLRAQPCNALHRR